MLIKSIPLADLMQRSYSEIYRHANTDMGTEKKVIIHNSKNTNYCQNGQQQMKYIQSKMPIVFKDYRRNYCNCKIAKTQSRKKQLKKKKSKQFTGKAVARLPPSVSSDAKKRCRNLYLSERNMPLYKFSLGTKINRENFRCARVLI